MHSSSGLAPTPNETRHPRAGRAVATRGLLVAGMSISLATAAPVLSTAGAATAPQFSYQASAFGTSVTVGSVVKSGRSAALTLGCTTDGNLHRTNSTTGLKLAPLATTGAVQTKADTYASPVRSSTAASTASVNLLNGLVKATAVKSVSSTTRTTSGSTTSSAGTTVTGLVVAGKAVSANAAPNTKINISGFGYLVVNEQVKKASGLTVNGLHLVVNTRNSLNIGIGTNVVISNAVSGLSGPVAGVVGGYSYGTEVRLGTTVSSGASFTAYMPCLGTGGVRRDNTGAAVNIPAVTTGTIVDTVQGHVGSTTSYAETTSTVQSAKVLNGLVQAGAIKSVARVSRANGVYTVGSTGSTFGSLTVKGQAQVNAKVAPNTRIALPGLGTLYLNRVLKTGKTVHVIAIHLVLTSPVDGVAAGTDIRVGVAKATIS